MRLRTPSAVGEGSYGALQTLPLLSGYASSVDRGVDSDLEDLADERGENTGPSPGTARREPEEEYTDRSHIVPGISMDPVRPGHRSADRPPEEGLGTGNVSGSSEESEDDDFEEDDPPDNSPCVTPTELGTG